VAQKLSHPHVLWPDMILISPKRPVLQVKIFRTSTPFSRDLCAKAYAAAGGAANGAIPADGVLSQRGIFHRRNWCKPKGGPIACEALLAGSEEEASRFAKGCFATTYLSPRDYHRVHMPIRGIWSRRAMFPETCSLSMLPRGAR